MAQYDIKPPENELEKMLHEPKSERGNVLEKKLAKKGALNANKLDNLQNSKLKSSDDEQSLANMLGVEEDNRKTSNRKKRKHKRKKRSLLPFRRKPKGPIKKLSKKARHTAMFLGLSIFPIFFLTLGIGMFLFIGAALNYAHQVEVISTLASPQYYAEMGSRGILGGSRKITDIPQDLIGQEPDLSVDYSHNHAMKSSSGKVGNIGNIKDGKDKYAMAYKVANGCAKLLPGVKPEWVFAHELAEFPDDWNTDRNFTGITYGGQKGYGITPSKGIRGVGGSEGGHYCHFNSWSNYCRYYAHLIKTRYSKAAHAKSLSEYGQALIDGHWMVNTNGYLRNMQASVNTYKKMKAHGGKMTGSAITLSGSSDDSNTTMFGNNRTKKVDPSDVTTKSGSLNDSDPHRTKRLLYFYSKRFAGNGSNGSSGSETITGGGAAKLRKIAKLFLGTPYVWGGGHQSYGMHKEGLDCSGLVAQIFWKCGIKQGLGNTVSFEDTCKGHYVKSDKDLQPGDLLFWGSKPHGSHHIAMYLGGGKYIQAEMPGTKVKIDPISYNHYDFAMRNPKMSAYVHKHAVIKKKHGGSGNGKSNGKYNPTATERWIITRESHGQVHARNPSGAYGIGQLMPNWYKKYTPGENWKNSKAVQLKAMRKYIKERYHTASAAKSFWEANGWY